MRLREALTVSVGREPTDEELETFRATIADASSLLARLLADDLTSDDVRWLRDMDSLVREWAGMFEWPKVPRVVQS